MEQTQSKRLFKDHIDVETHLYTYEAWRKFNQRDYLRLLTHSHSPSSFYQLIRGVNQPDLSTISVSHSHLCCQYLNMFSSLLLSADISV